MPPRKKSTAMTSPPVKLVEETVEDKKKEEETKENESEEEDGTEEYEGEDEEEDEEEEEEEDEDQEYDEPKTKRPRVIKRRPVFSDKLPAIPVAAFKRLVREVTFDQQLNKKDSIKWEKKALEALQVGAEAFVIDKFYGAGRRSLMCNKKTVAVGHFE